MRRPKCFVLFLRLKFPCRSPGSKGVEGKEEGGEVKGVPSDKRTIKPPCGSSNPSFPVSLFPRGVDSPQAVILSTGRRGFQDNTSLDSTPAPSNTKSAPLHPRIKRRAARRQ
ncbi:hypothetical protein E2C01_004408 [Portunus trituberculatus]|uniref:Uncharacterized protein n=1 Tax=Portunus trituberculatus TaxID=210409 RepID=A0A5B7CSX2_PORTR|nr:hypothetical protein [Portunus trituberculatus]